MLCEKEEMIVLGLVFFMTDHCWLAKELVNQHMEPAYINLWESKVEQFWFWNLQSDIGMICA